MSYDVTWVTWCHMWRWLKKPRVFDTCSLHLHTHTHRTHQSAMICQSSSLSELRIESRQLFSWYSVGGFSNPQGWWWCDYKWSQWWGDGGDACSFTSMSAHLAYPCLSTSAGFWLAGFWQWRDSELSSAGDMPIKHTIKHVKMCEHEIK